MTFLLVTMYFLIFKHSTFISISEVGVFPSKNSIADIQNVIVDI